MTLASPIRSIHSIGAALMLIAFAGPAVAALPSEDAATAAGQVLVETAAKGSIDDAFKIANSLRRPDDAVLAGALDERQKAVGTQLVRFGALDGRVRLVDSTYFAGCVRREYRVRYARGEQYWFLKFRRSPQGGWALFDLDVAAEPKA